MDKLFEILKAFLIAFSILAAACCCRADEADTGLVAAWSFNAGQGETTGDASGNNLTGHIAGASLVKEGKGSCLSFDGLDDQVDCGSSPALDLTDKLTLEAWIYVKGPSSGDWTTILSKDFVYRFGQASQSQPNKVKFGIRGEDNKWYSAPGGYVSLAPGEWHHLAGVFDAAASGSQLLFYVDGELKGSGDYAGRIKTSTGPFRIGGGTGYFNGLIDEVRIYKRALSAAELKQRYDSLKASFTAAGASLTDSPGDLLGYWPLNEGKGTIAFDKSGNGNNGYIGEGEWRQNDKGLALEFNGLKSYISIPHRPYLNIDDQLTIEAWVCPVTTTGSVSFFNKGPGNWMSGYNFMAVDGKLTFTAKTERYGGTTKNFKWLETATEEPVLLPQKWSHVAVTYSAAAGKTVLYLNGSPVKEAAAGGRICRLEGQENYNAAVSGLSLAPEYYYHLKGFLRELKIYRKALGPEEIASSYKQSSAAITELGRFMTGEELLRDRSTARVDLKVTDAATGKLLEAKVKLQGADGAYYYPDNGFNYGTRKEGHFYIFGQASVAVPPGKVNLKVARGFEWLPAETTVEVGDKESKEIVVKLARGIDMPARGWYCGEDELQYCAAHGKGGFYDHYNKLAGASMPEGFINACNICRAEGLNWVNFTSNIRYWNQGWDDKYYALVDNDTFTARHGLELRGEFGGDVIVINGGKLAGNNQREWLENALKAGGAANQADGSGDISNPQAYLLARLWPVWVALEKVNLWHNALLPFDSDGMKDTYRLLNLGFKAAQACGTDIYMIFSSPDMKPGCRRTYTRVKKLTWPDLAGAYKKQTLFATDGPLVLFTINGQDAGSDISLSEGNGKLKCALEAFSINGMEKVEIIMNGRVVRTIQAREGRIREEFELGVTESCWIAARAYGRLGEFAGGQAHTAPFYVQSANKRIKPAGEDVDYFLNWIGTLRKMLPEFRKNFSENQDWVVPLLDEAEKRFAVLKSGR